MTRNAVVGRRGWGWDGDGGEYGFSLKRDELSRAPCHICLAVYMSGYHTRLDPRDRATPEVPSPNEIVHAHICRRVVSLACTELEHLDGRAIVRVNIHLGSQSTKRPSASMFVSSRLRRDLHVPLDICCCRETYLLLPTAAARSRGPNTPQAAGFPAGPHMTAVLGHGCRHLCG